MAQLRTPEPKEQIKLILLGKTGHGKSATGNSILGQQRFESRAATKSVTKKVKQEFAVIGQYILNVVDGPGLEETGLQQIQQTEICITNMTQALAMCNGGVHAFLFVIKLTTRLTREERKAISDLKNIFGGNYLKEHGIIVITEGDMFKHYLEEEETPDKTFDEWWIEQDEDLFKECWPRVVLFNNRSKDEHEKGKQIDLLLQHVMKLAKKGLYTSEHFKQYEEIRAKMIKEENLPIFSEDMQSKISILSGTLLCLLDNPNLCNLDTLKNNIDELEKQIEQYGCHGESLKGLSNQLVAIRRITNALSKAIEYEKDVEEHVSALRKEQKDLEGARESPWKVLALRVCAFVGGVASYAAGAATYVLSGPALESLSKALFNVGTNLLKRAFQKEFPL